MMPTVPLRFLIAAALIAMLRAIPYLVARYDQPLDETLRFLPIGYNPMDFAAYLAFVNQGASVTLVNPYTVMPQDGRFILLFHQLLGLFKEVTNIDSFVLLELSRVPLIFFFTWAAWQFVCAVYKDLRLRTWAMWLLLFSGGMDYLFGLISYLPVAFALNENIPVLGLNTFQSLHNPLWIWAFALLLFSLRFLIDPESHFELKKGIAVFLSYLLLHLSHPYTAMALLAILTAIPTLALILNLNFCYRRYLITTLPVIFGLAVCVGISLWQTRDAVYKATASGVFGNSSLSVFFYPLTLGGLGIAALRGWRYWITGNHPWALPIGAWILVVILLHTSPIFNGYHFVPYLHIPVCLVATEPFVSWMDWIRARVKVMRGLVMIAYLAIFFFSPIATTYQSVLAVYRANARPLETFQVLEWLSQKPAGHVFCSGSFGLLVPVYTAHRVVVGHWFLSPDYRAKDESYYRLLAAENTELAEVLARDRIDYLVIPTAATEKIEKMLDGRMQERAAFGSTTVLRLRR
ncbi:MAG: hypothetical protein RMM17_02015 [Acidobacteriota bacterium]|nr:hypothetical protein [Blastocatellia bacterium]MDW8411446.1 hypothetical protein [Acidobacteriota bacterium]